jgi:hypothetical protein
MSGSTVIAVYNHPLIKKLPTKNRNHYTLVNKSVSKENCLPFPLSKIHFTPIAGYTK